MKSFNEWLKFKENWAENPNPDWWKGEDERSSLAPNYADSDSLHKTPPSVPMDRRKQMEEIYDYQERIIDLAERLPREKLLDILYKINPNKDFSKSPNRDLGIYIYTYFPTQGKPEGYKRLMEFLKKELSR